jgi:hypothetical protein
MKIFSPTQNSSLLNIENNGPLFTISIGPLKILTNLPNPSSLKITTQKKKKNQTTRCSNLIGHTRFFPSHQHTSIFNTFFVIIHYEVSTTITLSIFGKRKKTLILTCPVISEIGSVGSEDESGPATLHGGAHHIPVPCPHPHIFGACIR